MFCFLHMFTHTSFWEHTKYHLYMAGEDFFQISHQEYSPPLHHRTLHFSYQCDDVIILGIRIKEL